MGFTAATFCFCAHMCFSFNWIVKFFFRARAVCLQFFFRYNSLYFVLVLFMYCLTKCLCKCLCECAVFVQFSASLRIAKNMLSSIITILLQHPRTSGCSIKTSDSMFFTFVHLNTYGLLFLANRSCISFCRKVALYIFATFSSTSVESISLPWK